MDFLVQWLWYLLAFALGSLVAWVITVTWIKPAGEREAVADLGRSGADDARRDDAEHESDEEERRR